MKTVTTIGDGKSFLQPQQLNVLSSVVQTHAAPTTSDQYKFYPTMEVVDGLRGHGWFPVRAQEQRAVRLSHAGYQKHMIRFRREGTYLNNVGDIAPELILTNAHDGRASYRLMAGFFRLACLNGMIVSEGEFGQINVIHMGHERDDVIEASYKVIEEVPRLTEKIATYQHITLNAQEQALFAESALIMKYADDETRTSVEGDLVKLEDRSFSVSALLRSVRPADDDPSLWTTFNRVQEKMTKGNRFERTVHVAPNGRIVRKNKVPGITGINENIRVNRGLWHLMDEMAKIKTQARA